MAVSIITYNDNVLSFENNILSYSTEQPTSLSFNNYYALNDNPISGSPLPGQLYSTQLTFLPKVPGACVNGENVYFYMLSGDRYPGGVQFTYGLYRGNADGWTAKAQANSQGAWGNYPGTDWPTNGSAAQHAYSAIPGTDLSASLFRTCLLWDDTYDGIWVDWLYDDGISWTAYDPYMASINTANGSAFAVTDVSVAYNLFNNQTAAGTGTYNNVSGQYFFWGTKSYLE